MILTIIETARHIGTALNNSRGKKLVRSSSLEQAASSKLPPAEKGDIAAA